VPVVLVTNQSGLGRGLFSEAQFRAVQQRMLQLLAREGARIDASYHCPHAPDRHPACECRKPAPGLFHRAATDLGLDLARSFYVGDRPRDLLPGMRLGGIGILVRQGADPAVAAGPAPAGSQSVVTLEDAVLLVLAGLAAD
jgi:D-glycero-D-manno-heptose 1,7-bisphosphate phosphatase